jgi:predicted kinase
MDEINVTITGPRSTGKTMLARALKEMLGAQGIKAVVVRDQLDKHYLALGRPRRQEEVAGSIEALYHFPDGTTVIIDDSEEDGCE